MKVDLYLPYYDYMDGNSFDVSDDYYKSGNDYAKSLTMENAKNRNNSSMVFNGSLASGKAPSFAFHASDGQLYFLGEKTSSEVDKMAYSHCDGTLFSSDGSEETVDGLVSHFVRQESFVEMVEVDGDSGEEDFLSELSLWLREHRKINEYKDFKGEQWAWDNEPTRDLKVHFKNKADEDVDALFVNSKIMEIADGNALILFVEKVTLVG